MTHEMNLANALSSSEKACHLTLSLHGLLKASGQEDLARIAWTIYLETSAAAEILGDELEVEAAV